MPTGMIGPEAAAVAVANTLTTYLNAKLDAVNALWNDGTALPHPKKIYAYEVFEVPEYPAIRVFNLDGRLVGDMATIYQSMDHRVAIQIICQSGNKQVLQRQVLRYLLAMQQAVVEHQRLDGTLQGASGVSFGQYAVSKEAETGKGSMMLKSGLWLATVHSEDMLS